MKIKFGADITYFLWSVGTGFIFAVVYDFIRSLRKVLKTPDVLINIIDMLLLLVCGFLMIIEAYWVNNGEFRIYSVLCAGLSFLLYRLIMGNLLALIFGRFIKTLFKGIEKTARFLIIPIKTVIKIFRKTYGNILCIKDRIYSKINIKKAQ